MSQEQEEPPTIVKVITESPRVAVVFFDLECTGLSVYDDAIFEISLVLFEIDVKTGEWTERKHLTMRCKPLVGMSKGAAEVTGVTTNMLADEPPLKKQLVRMSKHLDAQFTSKMPRVLVGYNSHGYDIPMMVSEAEKKDNDVGTDGAVGLFRGLRFELTIDLLHQARAHVDRTVLSRTKHGAASFKLGDVYRSLVGKPLEGAHGALADSLALHEIYTKSTELTASLLKVLRPLTDQESKTVPETWCVNPLELVRSRVDVFNVHNNKPTVDTMSVAEMIAKIRTRKAARKAAKKLKLAKKRVMSPDEVVVVAGVKRHCV
jgi:DNA polymerase III epsilon subunit-like protein